MNAVWCQYLLGDLCPRLLRGVWDHGFVFWGQRVSKWVTRIIVEVSWIVFDIYWILCWKCLVVKQMKLVMKQKSVPYSYTSLSAKMWKQDFGHWSEIEKNSYRGKSKIIDWHILRNLSPDNFGKYKKSATKLSTCHFGHSLKLQTAVWVQLWRVCRQWAGEMIMFMHIVGNVRFIYKVMVLLLSITVNKGFSRKATCIVHRYRNFYCISHIVLKNCSSC